MSQIEDISTNVFEIKDLTVYKFKQKRRKKSGILKWKIGLE